MDANSRSYPSAGCPRTKSKRRFAGPRLALAALLGIVTVGTLEKLSAQEPSVSMKVDLVAWGDDIHGLSLKKGSTKGEITALGFRYSEPLSYSGPVLMEIHQTGGGPSKPSEEMSQDDKDHELMPLVVEEVKPKPGDEPRTPIAIELEKRRKENPSLVALAQLPGLSCKRATVLLAPAASGTFIAHVIDDDPSNLPPGKLRVHNLSPYEITLRCNSTENKELKTRGTHVFNAAKNQIIYELAYKKDGEWVVQENNIISIAPSDQVQMMVLRSRNQFFLSSDGSTGGFLQNVILRRESAR